MVGGLTQIQTAFFRVEREKREREKDHFWEYALFERSLSSPISACLFKKSNFFWWKIRETANDALKESKKNKREKREESKQKKRSNLPPRSLALLQRNKGRKYKRQKKWESTSKT